MDKFVNATRLIGVLDSAIARPRARGNAKSIDDMWCDMAMQYTKRILEEEISAGGEFRRVVHAHCIVSVPAVMTLLELTVHGFAVPAVLLWTSRRLRLKTIEVDG